MSAHKSIDKICMVIIAVTLIISVVFCSGQALGIQTTAHAIGYENRIFDHSKVHTLDIVINDWDGFIETCENEEYTSCNLIIDGEAVKNVGIRAKGNTSLSSVRNMNSSRYSFKIEFDQYENGKTYHGLDKLCLNNIIQDNTYMKDYLAYSLMYDFGVDAPLCSYTYITVNGEDWGLYLAVEAIEESFLERNYGSNYGDLYKPDAMGFGGGRGNGKEFSMGNFTNKESKDKNSSEETNGSFTPPSNFGGGMPDFGGGEMPDFGNFDPENMPEDFDPSKMFGGDGEMPDFGGGKMPDMNEKGGFGGGFGMGSDDVKLKYTDDDIDSYSNIFNNAKTTVNKADKNRLISSLKALSEQADLENTVDTEEVIRYFVVHDFLVNGDSYTGQMIHNYYLYEENGQLSMIPWDYNLAYGSFMGGNASSSVNSPIDTPVSNGMSDRPMVSWIFDNEEYTEQYHKLFSEFINSVDFEKLITDTAELIDKYVEKDPTKFCTYEEFNTGVEAIKKFCSLRAESVTGQLNGTIPSTTDGQKADSSALIDTDGLNTSDMGSMGGMGGFGGNQRSNSSDKSNKDQAADKNTKTDTTEKVSRKSMPNTSSLSVVALSSMQVPEGSGKGERNGNSSNDSKGNRPDFGSGQPPQGFGGDMPQFDPDNMPEGFDPNNMPDFGGEMPEGFDPGNIPDDIKGDFEKNKNDNSSDIYDYTEKTTSATADDGNAELTEETTEAKEKSAPADKGNDNSSPEKGDRSRGGERPDMGGFSSMNGGVQENNTTAYILLGVSGLILLLGLGFALKFKR